MIVTEPDTYRRKTVERGEARPPSEGVETFAAAPRTNAITRSRPRPRKGLTLGLPLGLRARAGAPPEPAEQEALLGRREELLQKFDLGPDERSELALLDWKLERIEERELDPALARLEALAALGKRFAKDLKAFHEQLGQRVKQQRPDQPWARQR